MIRGYSPLRSRVVRWLRIILPIAALAILSGLFLLAKKPAVDAAIPYSDATAADLATAAGMTAPRYAGVTPNGTEVALNAAHAIPDGANAVATQVALNWKTPGGLTATINADDGRVDGSIITLKGAVRMTTSTGWQLTAPAIDANIATDVLIAPGDVSAQGPLGTIDAGSMSMARYPDGAHVIDFNSGVRLIYKPRP